MILIIGGVYQGKLAYALERCGLGEEGVYRCSEQSVALPQGKRIIYELDKWLLALLRASIDPDREFNRFRAANADAVVICNDISCGIVPMEAELRSWRETVGRALISLSVSSEEVVRLFCGIPTRLK